MTFCTQIVEIYKRYTTTKDFLSIDHEQRLFTGAAVCMICKVM